ncbi:MAG: monomeric [FeFe] hydrogenase [Marinifilaceae bacterium]|jgi:[FeFe] hydrogenase (group B1/B3)|nr:monomeric [FeFe] hydrogenase [Marinifilaceae bacterium]
MAFTNNAKLIRREMISRVCELLANGELEAKIDRIPVEMVPKDSDSVRCCIYKDRAVAKYKLMALLGFNICEEEDELTPLSDYVRMAMNRPELTKKVLTVVDIACKSCVNQSYIVTNMCKGCLARPCMLNCPKDAISFIGGQAHIDPDKCVNCGICQRECPYHAIIHQPIPCEESCPVGAISKNNDGVEHIDRSKCIHCGKCMTACPFGAIMAKSHLVEIFKSFHAKKKVVAGIAPAIFGQFNASKEQIIEGIKKIGFSDVIEVAEGADITAEHEAKEFIHEVVEGEQDFMTTSCCPAYVNLVNKHLPELKPYVSTTRSPMHYTAQLVKDQDPDSIFVFVGPCVAKRQEAFYDEYVNYVLTFEELGALFVSNGVDVSAIEDIEEINKNISKEGRGFALSGGVANAIKSAVSADTDYRPELINGLTKKEIKLMKMYNKRKPNANFIEVMSCEGGCIAGPDIITNPKIGNKYFAKNNK